MIILKIEIKELKKQRIMDYEEKYRKLVDAIKELRDINSHDKGIRNWINDNVPELAESDDERIRRALITYFYGFPYNCLEKAGTNPKEAIAWLEKQGCQKSVDKEYTFKSIPRLLEMIEPTNRAKSYCQKLIDSLLQEGYTTDAKIVSDYLKQMNGEKVGMATMDEQKSDWNEEEVNLKKEFDDYIERQNAFTDNDNSEIKYYNGDLFNHVYDIYPIAKYFFELGLKTKVGEE